MSVYTETEVIRKLKKACKEAGGQVYWARANGVSKQYLNDVLRRKSDIGESIYTALNLKPLPRLWIRKDKKFLPKHLWDFKEIMEDVKYEDAGE